MRPVLTRLVRALVASVLLLLIAGAAVVAAADIGHKDFADSGGSTVTGSKPESKVWYNDGLWWASMQPSTGGGFFIYKLDPNTDSWVSTGVPLDNRNGTRADTLWDGTKLYVASQRAYEGNTLSTASGTGSSYEARLYRFSYSASTDTYSLDNGFPAIIRSGWRTESLVIDKDSTGRLWATWTQTSGSNRLVYTNHSQNGNDASWSTPAILPVGSQGVGVTTDADDISTIIAFNVSGQGRIGVLWSNQTDQKDYFAWHVDGAADSTWTAETALSGTNQADDHVNLKTDSSGQVYAVVKTSLTGSNPLIKLLRRTTTGSWSNFVVGIDNVGSNTRPILELEEKASGNVLHVFMTGARTAGGSGQSGGDIFEKTSPVSSISFPAGLGTSVIRDDASAKMNNVTSTKQNFTATTGIVVLAFNDTTDFYWHASESFGPPPDPLAGFTASPTSGTVPQPVSFTNTTTGTGPFTWAWDFGDGGTSTVQNPSHTYTVPGTYTVRLTATGANGADTSTQTDLITVVGPTATITLTPQADAQVKSSSATANYGTLGSVRTREDPGTGTTYRTYLRFNVQGLTGSVTSVKLRLYATDPSPNVQSVYPIVTFPNWIESGTGSITWNNAPTIGSTLLGSSSVPTVNAYNEIPLNSSSISGNGLITFAIKSSGTNSAVENSKEAGSFPPQLVITQSIAPSGPTADFVATTATSGGAPLNVTFDASASTGTGLTYAWDFGDSSNGTGVNPTHQYTAPGTYTVSMTVTDASNATANKTRTNYIVVDSAPNASFTQDKTTGNAPLTVSFDASGSTGTNLVYAWNFGDPGSGSANTSTLQKPQHTFSAVDTFNVTLTVSNAAGSSGPVSVQITVTGGSPTTITLSPIADAHVNSGSPTANYGTLASIRTREDGTLATPTYRPYYQFNVPSFSGTVSSVKLRLFVTSASANMTQSVYLVGNGWTESGLTWTNAPALPGSSIGSAIAGTANAYVEFTLTTPISPSATYSFALKSSGTTSVYFNTKEAASNPPQLVIVYQ